MRSSQDGRVPQPTSSPASSSALAVCLGACPGQRLALPRKASPHFSLLRFFVLNLTWLFLSAPGGHNCISLLSPLQTFQANEDATEVVLNKIHSPVLTRFVRIRPQSWHNGIALRLELYGCRITGEHLPVPTDPPLWPSCTPSQAVTAAWGSSGATASGMETPIPSAVLRETRAQPLDARGGTRRCFSAQSLTCRENHECPLPPSWLLMSSPSLQIRPAPTCWGCFLASSLTRRSRPLLSEATTGPPAWPAW